MSNIKIAIKWLKTNYKLAIFILASIIIAVFLLLLKIENNKLKNDYQLKSVELSVYKDSTSIYKSKSGLLTAKIQAVEIESSNAKKALELAGFEKQELKDRNVKLSKINFALNARLEAIGSGSVILHDTIKTTKTDTITAQVGTWSNGYLALYPEVVLNKLDFKYKYTVDFKVIGETNKTISLALTDKDATFTTANAITIKKKSYIWNKWYIHVGAGLVGGYFLFK